jgi:hypothetical protein
MCMLIADFIKLLFSEHTAFLLDFFLSPTPSLLFFHLSGNDKIFVRPKNSPVSNRESSCNICCNLVKFCCKLLGYRLSILLVFRLPAGETSDSSSWRLDGLQETLKWSHYISDNANNFDTWCELNALLKLLPCALRPICREFGACC